MILQIAGTVNLDDVVLPVPCFVRIDRPVTPGGSANPGAAGAGAGAAELCTGTAELCAGAGAGAAELLTGAAEVGAEAGALLGASDDALGAAEAFGWRVAFVAVGEVPPLEHAARRAVNATAVTTEGRMMSLLRGD